MIETSGDNINVAWSPQGKYIIVGNRNDVLRLYDVRMNKLVKEKSFPYEVNEISFDKSGTFLFSGKEPMQYMFIDCSRLWWWRRRES